MITRLYIFCGGSIHFIDNEASQLEVAFDLHVEKIESKLQEWKMKTYPKLREQPSVAVPPYG